MTSRILNIFNIKTDRLLRSIATDKLSCDIHPRKIIKMVRLVSRDHIIIIYTSTFISISDNIYIHIYTLIHDNTLYHVSWQPIDIFKVALYDGYQLVL